MTDMGTPNKDSRLDHTPRILSLDGGGIRGLPSRFILKELMEQIKAKKNTTDVPRPFEYFDLIGATSTEGLIAIMLGLLRMVLPLSAFF